MLLYVFVVMWMCIYSSSGGGLLNVVMCM